MKTKEFIKRVEELGFEVWISGSTAYVLKNGQYTVARIKTKRACAIDFFYILNESLDKEISEKLFDIIVEYAKTPLDEREKEKKFYLRHRWLKPEPIYKNYLNHWIVTNEYWLDCKNEIKDVQTQFTIKEIDEIKEKFNTDLCDFKRIEVE